MRKPLSPKDVFRAAASRAGGSAPFTLFYDNLGACQAIATLLFARMQDVPLDGVRVEVEGDLDPDGFTGKAPDVRNGLQEVRFSMHLKSSDEAAARALAALVEERCPVSDCLKAPVPVVCAEVVVE